VAFSLKPKGFGVAGYALGKAWRSSSLWFSNLCRNLRPAARPLAGDLQLTPIVIKVKIFWGKK